MTADPTQFAETESPSWVDRVRRYLLALYPQRAETGSTKTGRLIAQSEPISCDCRFCQHNAEKRCGCPPCEYIRQNGWDSPGCHPSRKGAPP